MQIVTKNLSRPIPPLWDDPLTAALAADSKTSPLKEGFSGECIVFSTGRENDGTGLYYYRARYYSPILQRFIGEDLLGIYGGINFYVYVGNNPVNGVDPFGLFEIIINDPGGRGGDAYGGTITVIGSNGQTVTVPGSSWPNPTNPSPGIAPGTYPGTYSLTGHRGRSLALD